MEVIPTSSCPQDIQPVLGTWYPVYDNISERRQLQVAYALSGSLYIVNDGPLFNYNGPAPVSASRTLKISQTTYSASAQFGENVAVSASGDFLSTGQGIVELPDGQLWYGSRLPREQVVMDVNGVRDTSWDAAINSSDSYFGIGNRWTVGRSDNYVYSATISQPGFGDPNDKLHRYNISTKTLDSGFKNANDRNSCLKILGISGSSGITSVAFGGWESRPYRAAILYETGSSYNWVDLNSNSQVRDIVQHGNYLYWAGSFSSFNGVSVAGWVKTDLDGNVVTGSMNYITGSFGGQYEGIRSIGVQSDGKIILGSNYNFYGYYENVPGYNFETGSGALIRLNTDGTFDDTFNYPNIVLSYSGSQYVPFDGVYVNSLAILENDEIFAGGIIVAAYDSASYTETINGQGGILLNPDGGIKY